jgi:hypothetical protein
MSSLLTSFAAVALTCSGTQSSPPLWIQEPTKFQILLEASDFFGTNGPFEWELKGRKVSDGGQGELLLAGTIKALPTARFAARLTTSGLERQLTWEVAETTSIDGRSTLQARGSAICSADNQASKK